MTSDEKFYAWLTVVAVSLGFVAGWGAVDLMIAVGKLLAGVTHPG